MVAIEKESTLHTATFLNKALKLRKMGNISSQKGTQSGTFACLLISMFATNSMVIFL